MKQIQTGQPLYSKTGQVYLLLTTADDYKPCSTDNKVKCE